MGRIFLCYASQDREKVEEIYRRLQELGFQPWMDKRDLLAGLHWDKETKGTLQLY